VKVPARSTIQAILDRHGLVTRAKRSRTHTEGTPLSCGLTPNALWCTDYKGEFQLGNKRYFYPLTVTDHASRYLLLCEAMQSNQEQFAFTAFDHLFKERVYRKRSARTTAYILPHPMVSSISRSSRFGGCAWASASNAFAPVVRNRTAGMSACTSRSKKKPPGQLEPTSCNSKPSSTLLRRIQQRTPARSARHEMSGPRCIPLRQGLAGQTVGIKEVDDGIWLVSFMDYDLGYIDLEEKTLQPLDNPFRPKCSGPRS
jgi:hypothetical protein